MCSVKMEGSEFAIWWCLAWDLGCFYFHYLTILKQIYLLFRAIMFPVNMCIILCPLLCPQLYCHVF